MAAATPVFSAPRTRELTGTSGDYLDIAHKASLALANATISLSFALDRLPGDYALVSKDGNGRSAGDFTVWVKDGTLVVTQDSAGATEYLKVPDLVLEAQTTYQFALSLGKDGLMIWLNGALVAAEPQFKQGIATNSHPLVVGGSRAWRDSDSDAAHSLFKGSIGDLRIFDKQLGEADMQALAAEVDPALAMGAGMQAAMADLAPVFGQLHHGSDTLKEILADYGVSAHGHLMQPLKMVSKGGADHELRGSKAADGLDGGGGDDVVKGGGGADVLQGGSGNDRLLGGAGNDILDGGEGEDRLFGGNGDDLLISRADGREGAIYFDPDRDEGDPLNELTDGKLYPDQPVPGDDALTGGKGADIFYFQTLINAKERYIEKHTNDDGSINWHGVAGENDKLHDHWVDTLGDDVVMDYSRAEGDRLVIEGHTTKILSVSYGDANGDGVLDHSVIALYSDQGNNGGAHNDDRLGTITVYGDLVKRSDIETTAAPAYGIVAGIADLDAALAPTAAATEGGRIKAPGSLPGAQDLGLRGGALPVAAINGTTVFSGDSGDYMDVGHLDALALPNATISLSFALDRLPGDYALVSKDGNGRSAGDFTVWVKDGTLVVTQDSAGATEYLKVPDLVLEAQTTYQFALSLGKDGLMIWLNGALVAAEPQFKQGIATNSHPLVVGGSRAWRDSDSDAAHSLFKGSIGDLRIFDKQLGEADMQALAAEVDPALAMGAGMQAAMADLAPVFGQLHHGSDTLKEILADYGVSAHGHLMQPLKMVSKGGADHELRGSKAADGLDGGGGDDVVKGGGGADVLQGGSGNDRLLGGAGNDILDGGEGEDRLFGGNGDDLLISRADGREGAIYFDPDRDEGDPLNELTDGKLYPDQPVPGDDALTGGKGADIFYFQTLINAKERYIEKHTNDDGSINWHGVAGENDKLHDHWVDTLGDDVVMDYSRAEGDRLVIEGHTTKILSVSYGDANGDGVLDHSVIALYSDQGNNGGAHNDDRLGTITVYGDLVKRSDIETTAAPAYGIVAGIADLDAALAPTAAATEGGRIKAPGSLPGAQDLGVRGKLAPVLAAVGSHSFSPEDKAPLIVDHTKAVDLKSGTIAFAFTAADIGTFQTLFSKDASGDGYGHLSAYVTEIGSLVVRIQDRDSSHYLQVDHAVRAGDSHQLALSFGDDGLQLFLNGARVAYRGDIGIDLSQNTESFVIGANGWSSTPGTTDMVHSHFDGTITDFMVFDKQLSGEDIFGAAPRADFAYFDRSVQAYAFGRAQGDLVVKVPGAANQTLADDIEFIRFADMTVRVDEIQFGSGRDDAMSGRDGADILLGRDGDDDLHGHNNDDLLRGEAGDDDLRGGRGADRLDGGAGNDRLYGGEDNDVLRGGDGADQLYGEGGNDKLYGGLGDDRFYGHLWNDAGNAGKDRVYFDGEFDDYSFDTATWTDKYRGGAVVTQLTVTDSADGGADGFYEGADRLIDIDLLVFADRTVAFDDLL